MSDFNLDEFLTTELGITAEELDTAKGLFNEERAKKLRDGYSRQSDYSRRMDALKKEQDALAAQAVEIAKIKNQAEREAAEARWEAQVAQLELKQARDEYGIPPLEVEKPPKPEPPKKEESGFSREDAVAALNNTLRVQAALSDIRDDYRELFPGRRFDTQAFMEKVVANAAKGKTIFDTAEEEFKFSQVRRQKEIDAAVAKAKEELNAEWQQKFSQHEVPTAPRRDEERSPLLRGKDRAEKADPNRGRAQALAYLREKGHPV